MTDEPEDQTRENADPREPLTPEEEAYRTRVEAFRVAFGKRIHKAGEWLAENLPNYWGNILIGLLKGGLNSLKHYIEDPAEEEVSWGNPWVETRYPAEWDWEEERLLYFRPDELPESVSAALRKGEDPTTLPEVNEYIVTQYTRLAPFLVLQSLTHSIAVHVEDGKPSGYSFQNQKDAEDWHALPSEEARNARLDELLEPFSIGGLETVDEDGQPLILVPFGEPEATPETLPEWADRIRKAAKDLLKFTFKGDAGGVTFKGALVFMVHPLVVDEDSREAYFPIVVGLAFVPSDVNLDIIRPVEVEEEGFFNIPPAAIADLPDPSAWSEQDKADLWKVLLEDIPELLRKGIGAAEEKPAESATQAATTGATAPPPTLVMTPVGAPSPARRRSVMSPYPLPRTLAKDAHTIALNRGLGRMFGSVAKIPDLDFRGDTALQEAEALFWAALEDYLEKALAGRTPPASWTREPLSDGKTVIFLFGIQEAEARTLWFSAIRGMNATEKGPGLEVAEPSFTNENRFDQASRQVLITTRLLLWPDDHLRIREDELLPPVKFRSERSRGYLDLLDRQGPRPFFADGWLWLPRGDEREGFRIAGLPRLLFPEGRKALERLSRRNKGEHETELNRLLRNPTLFQDEDAKVVRELRSAIAKTEAWLKELSLYDTRDLTLCIFEAWYRQRDAWFREVVTLEDGKEVSTAPYRIIRLDPEDLRLRLDPKTAGGANWRSRLFKKLEALTTFERQTRDRRNGRKVDVGDRLVERVIDGFRGEEETSTPEQDPGLGLTRLLKKAGGIPSRSFYAVVSVDFMERLVTWAVDERGAVRWGLEAAKAAERVALAGAPEKPKNARKAAEEKRNESKGKPYFDGSPRLMSLYNLEDWPQEVKDLAHVLLQEVTHKKGGARLDGVDFVACGGSYGKGYKVQAWVIKWGGHLLRTGPRGGVQAFAGFLKALRFLSSHDTLNVRVELRPPRKRGETPFQKSTWNEEALAVLESYKDNPPTVYDLKLVPYLPEDLEDRLRNRLSEDGIEGVDEDEAGTSVFTPPVHGGLSPADIRRARKLAGWEQAELAAKVGVSRVIVSYWENAKKPVPRDRMARLQEVLEPYLDEGPKVRGVTCSSPKDPSV